MNGGGVSVWPHRQFSPQPALEFAFSSSRQQHVGGAAAYSEEQQHVFPSRFAAEQQQDLTRALQQELEQPQFAAGKACTGIIMAASQIPRRTAIEMWLSIKQIPHFDQNDRTIMEGSDNSTRIDAKSLSVESLWPFSWGFVRTS